MKNIGYILTDWMFFFNEKSKENIKSILIDAKNTDLLNEFITWKLITVFLPLVTFALALILNVATNLADTSKFLSYFNNGSLPIISFGILTSGMPYLLEQLQDYPDFHIIRRRVMSVALIFLFLSASLYILQTLTILNSQINILTNWLFFALSLLTFITSSSIGYKMFLLQSKNAIKFEEEMSKNVEKLEDATKDL